MIFFKRFSTMILLPLIVVSVILYCASLPENPGDPSNTAISIVMKTSDGKIHPNSLADTVNKKFSIGGALRLPENFDTIHLTITFKEDTIFDTTFTNFEKTEFYSDTIWIERTLFTPGLYYATFTPVTSLNVNPITANIMMVEADLMPENHKPVISVSGKIIFSPGDTCVLTVLTSDADASQILTAATKGKPEGSLLINNKFTWIIPSTFTGLDTISFVVNDNGYPQGADTQTVVITVTSTPHPPLIAISGDSIIKPLETCTLTVNTSDKDSGQTQIVTMSGFPEGAVLVNNSKFIWTAPNVTSAKHIVTFTATDNGIPPLSTSVNVTISVSSETGNLPNSAPKWSVDTLLHTMNATGTYSLSLSGICSDTDKDKLTYTLLAGTPQADTIIDSNYTFAASVSAAGTHLVKITAADPQGATDTLVINLTVDQSTVDTTVPQIVLVAPGSDSAASVSPSFTIDIMCSDASGIASVSAKFGETLFPALHSSGHYTITINGLIPGVDNIIAITAKDSSIAGNSFTKNIFIRYNAAKTVTYNANTATGTAPTDDNKYTAGAAVTIKDSASLVKTGFTFAGWNTAADGSGTAHAVGTVLTMGSTNIVLFAQWTTNPTFTVTYNANTGTGTAPIDANKYETAAVITVMSAGTLTKAGTTFAGWNTAADGSGTAHAAATTFAMGSADIVLFAQWTTNPTFTVTYDANTGAGTAPADVNKYETEATITVLGAGTLTKAGATFAGWNTKADGSGTAHTAGTTLAMRSANLVLFAQWTTNPTFTVTYDANTGAGTAPIDVNKYETGSTITVLGAGTLVRNWYTFTGWNTAANGSGTARAAGSTFEIGNANVTLYAQWKLIPTFIVTYNGNNNSGGTAPTDPGTYVQGTTVSVATAGTLIRNGYTFAGWNTEVNGSGTPRTAGSTFEMGSTNVTLYAQWQKIRYLVTFKNNVSTQTNTEYYDAGSTILSSQYPGFTIGGYELSYWDKTSITVNAPMTVTAYYVALDCSASQNDIHLWSGTGETFNLIVTVNNSACKITKYEWYMVSNTYYYISDGEPGSFTANGQTTNKLVVNKVTGGAYGISCIVTFENGQQDTVGWGTESMPGVNFNPGDGSGSMDDQRFKPGETFKLNPCSFTRAGYRFAGWCVDAECSMGTAFSDQATVTFGNSWEYLTAYWIEE